MEPLPDGIYRDMPDADYHALQRLSSSGVKNLLVSPMTFWTRSWLNTRRDNSELDHLLKGKAYHARIVEGATVFAQRYAYKIDQADHPDALDTNDQLKAFLKDHGEKQTGNKTELIERVLAIEPEAEIWSELQRVHAFKHDGQQLLPAEWHGDIERGAAYIEAHPTIGKCFDGGEAELTVLWTHTFEAGDGSGRMISVPMKSRFDRLKSAAIIDFKTYANAADMEPGRAVARAVAAYRYHLQAAVYYRAADFAQAKGWISDQPREFVFVFQGTGDDPLPIARVMSRQMNWIDVGWRQLDIAAEIYDRNMERFGADPWISTSAVEHFADDDFPAWMAG